MQRQSISGGDWRGAPQPAVGNAVPPRVSPGAGFVERAAQTAEDAVGATGCAAAPATAGEVAGGRVRSTPLNRAAGRAWPARAASCPIGQRPPPALGLR